MRRLQGGGVRTGSVVTRSRQTQRQRSNTLLDETPYLTCTLGTDVAQCVLLGISTAPFSTGDIPMDAPDRVVIQPSDRIARFGEKLQEEILREWPTNNPHEKAGHSRDRSHPPNNATNTGDEIATIKHCVCPATLVSASAGSGRGLVRCSLTATLICSMRRCLANPPARPGTLPRFGVLQPGPGPG